MGDKQRIFQPPARCDLSCKDAQENCVVRSVVKNVVDNMESVLNDLHGIMGEITAIVEHIDTVTDKMGKNRREKKYTSNAPSKNCFSKHTLGNKSNYISELENNFFNSRADTINSTAGKNHMQSSKSFHNIAQVNALNTNKKLSLNDDVKLIALKCQDFSNKERKHDISIPKSCSRFLKDPSRNNPQTGVIAIVYPTIVNNVSIEPHDDVKELIQGLDVNNYGQSLPEKYFEEPIFQKCPDMSNVIKHSKEMLSQVVPLNTEPSINKLLKIMQINGPQTNDETSFKSLDNPLLFSETKVELPSAHLSSGSEDNISAECQQSFYSIREQSNQLNMIAVVKTSDISSQKDYNAKLETSSLSRDNSYVQLSNFGPQLKSLELNNHNTVKTARFHSNNLPMKSLNPGHQVLSVNNESLIEPHLNHCLESKVSDIKSHDNKSATTVTDCSNLNLVGDSFVLNKVIGGIPTNKSHNVEITEDHRYEQGNFHPKKQNNNVISSENLKLKIISPALGTEIIFDKSQSSMAVQNVVLNSPIWTHFFCNEITHNDPDAYCGNYEAVLDCVLEDPTVFEPLKDVIENLDCIDNKTFLNFKDKNDNHDSGTKLTPDNQFQYATSLTDSSLDKEGSANIHAAAKNDFHATDNSNRPRQKLANTMTHKVNNSMPGRSTEDTTDVKQASLSKGFCTHTDTFFESYRSKSHATGCHISGDTNKNIRAARSNQETFTNIRSTLFKKSGDTNQEEKRMDKNDVYRKTQRDDVTSEFDVQSLSSMSVSSMDSTFWMSEAGGTSDEGSVYFVSGDSHSISSDTSSRTSSSLHRAKMKKLRRDFFKSFYLAGDTKDAENKDCKDICPRSSDSSYLDDSFSGVDDNKGSESESYQETMASYNKNINPWTTFAFAHQQAYDTSDSASDIYNEKTSKYSTTPPVKVHDDGDLQAQV